MAALLCMIRTYTSNICDITLLVITCHVSLRSTSRWVLWLLRHLVGDSLWELCCVISTTLLGLYLTPLNSWMAMANLAASYRFRTYAQFELKCWQLRISRWPPLQSLQWTQRLRLWNTNTGAGRVWGGEVSWALSALRKFGNRQMFCFLQYDFSFKSVWPNLIWSLVDAWQVTWASWWGGQSCRL